jgi:hypothetical protein
MPVVQIPVLEQYGKAIGLLLRMGGMFRTRHPHVLVIGETQYQALVHAGLVKGSVKSSSIREQGRDTLSNRERQRER